ncbi:MAG: MFS transporter [Rhodospirillaceae bacterium]|nr:MFS transporter [Rhodospirillaceae bacterium]MAX64300.1 MFS transporter [Rhodospirillaceae bacterium]|tara:strand:- start:468 stop:1706 length:1239 start_codon:yes stop_codon:yes gene_type:complete
MSQVSADHSDATDTPYSWFRLGICLILSTIGGVGLWSSVVVLPSIELEFGLDRGGASFPYTATMIGFALGGVLMGRLVDRFGIAMPIIMAATMIGAGYVLSSFATNFWTFLICQAVLIGMLGSSATFGPMVADVSHWFLKRRGLAIAIVASGNYLAGAIWPPILQEAIVTIGWRGAFFWVGVFCFCTMIPLALLLRRRPDIDQGAVPISAKAATASAPVSPNVVLMLLIVAGVGCCVAMSMPQVHIVAYCGDLGYGPAVGAEMLSLMLGLGVISRLASGVIADKIGGVGTLILGSTLQCLALLFYLPFDGLVSLYLVSALFGLSQGGIVPSYALIVREYFPARQAGSRVGIVLMATVLGMALGGWMSGEIYDLTGSYQAAFLNGIAFNLLNMSIAFWLLYIRRPKGPKAAVA